MFLLRGCAGISAVELMMAYKRQKKKVYNKFLKCLRMQSSYSECSLSEESIRSAPAKKEARVSEGGIFRGGLWEQEERLRYVAFVHFNKDLLNSRLLRRTSKVFKQMSNFVGTRSPAQCRSQNQKVYRRFKTVNKIVAVFRQEVGAAKYDQAFITLRNDPAIRFAVDEAKQSSSDSEPSRCTVDTFAQTDEGILVVMNAEEYQFWTAIRAINCPLLLGYSHFQHFAQSF